MSERLALANAAAKIEATQETSQEDKLRSSLLIFACAFMNFAVMFRLAIYWLMGQNYSSNVPLAYQAVSISSLVFYDQQHALLIDECIAHKHCKPAKR